MKSLSLIISVAIGQYNHISGTCQICELEMPSGRCEMQTGNRSFLNGIRDMQTGTYEVESEKSVYNLLKSYPE